MKKDELTQIEEVYRLYYNDAFFYIYSLSHDESVSEDIVMEAFCKALQTNNKEFTNFKSWLLKVCRNDYFDYCRKSNKHKNHLFDEEKDSDDSIIEKLIIEERKRSLYKAIELLSDIERECVYLYYFNNLSVKDISAIIKKDPDNVKVILYRARQSLKRKMED